MSCGTVGCTRLVYIDHLDLSLRVHLAHQTIPRCLSQGPGCEWVMRCTRVACGCPSWPAGPACLHWQTRKPQITAALLTCVAQEGTKGWMGKNLSYCGLTPASYPLPFSHSLPHQQDWGENWESKSWKTLGLR